MQPSAGLRPSHDPPAEPRPLNTAVISSLVQCWPHKPYTYCGVPAPGLGAYMAAVIEQAAREGAATLFAGHVTAPLGLLQWQPLEWDSQLLDRSVARITYWIHSHSDRPDESLLRAGLESARASGVTYLLARIPAGDIAGAQALERHGFVLIDLISTFGKVVPAEPASLSGGHIECGEYRAEEVPALKEIAAGSFQMGRFHGDPVLEPSLASAAYCRWLEDSCSGFADAVIVARWEGTPVGFTTIKLDPLAEQTMGLKVAVVGLVAVSDVKRNCGVGRELVAASLLWCRNTGARWIEVGTQTANIPACRLYEGAGFRSVGSSVTYRRLLPSGGE